MAAVNDAFSDLQSVAAGSYLDIRPSNSGEEVTIFNVESEVGCPFELYKYDGTNLKQVGTFSAGGLIEFIGGLVVTRSLYYRLKNTHASTKFLGFGGMYTKA